MFKSQQNWLKERWETETWRKGTIDPKKKKSCVAASSPTFENLIEGQWKQDLCVGFCIEVGK